MRYGASLGICSLVTRNIKAQERLQVDGCNEASGQVGKGKGNTGLNILHTVPHLLTYNTVRRSQFKAEQMAHCCAQPGAPLYRASTPREERDGKARVDWWCARRVRPQGAGTVKSGSCLATKAAGVSSLFSRTSVSAYPPVHSSKERKRQAVRYCLLLSPEKGYKTM